jgi:release factor glutamine methyltransferase
MYWAKPGLARFFFVDENVLIPRPETEELTDWLLNDSAGRNPDYLCWISAREAVVSRFILKKAKGFQDHGTGHISEGLWRLQKNSRLHDADVDFILMDIRDPDQWGKLPFQDLIISNPPYIPEKQKRSMDKHVKDFEPGVALFVPDEDPILFYKIIGGFGLQKLKPAGLIFLEIHHDYADQIVDWYGKNGYAFELKRFFRQKQDDKSMEDLKNG